MSSPAPQTPSNGADDGWSPSSWRSKPVAQPVIYPDETKLKGVLEKIQKLPPLVSPGEVGIPPLPEEVEEI
ncbi:hypothetical protein FRC01_006087 [Tulasnella sp. 417]|nr:hypothetical protein FRC01_006087 [Tulasnella sp. 417]